MRMSHKRADEHSDFSMEPTDGIHPQSGTDSGPTQIQMYEEEIRTGAAPPPTPLLTHMPLPAAREEGRVARVDLTGSYGESPQTYSPHSHIALPEKFTGQKMEFWRIQRQFRLCIMANEDDF
jgi:hypothetical protein